MRNAQAARYARWAAAIAFVIAATVVAVFITRSARMARAQREAPKAVASTIRQESAEFTFSKVEQERTIYTVKASRATQFKDQDASELEDVTIIAYGRDSSRNDTLHTNKCTYQTGSGSIRCEGPAQMEIESADSPDHHPNERAIHVETSDVTFDRDSGEASTAAVVVFPLPEWRRPRHRPHLQIQARPSTPRAQRRSPNPPRAQSRGNSHKHKRQPPRLRPQFAHRPPRRSGPRAPGHPRDDRAANGNRAR